jgi:serine/threonine protein kinase
VIDAPKLGGGAQRSAELAAVPIPRGPLGLSGPAPRSRPAPPAIPGFEVGEALGKGGMGVVYRARELATARDVAIKWLPARSDEVLRKRFEREARAAAAVRHPNIVPILSAGSTSSIAM